MTCARAMEPAHDMARTNPTASANFAPSELRLDIFHVPPDGAQSARQPVTPPLATGGLDLPSDDVPRVRNLPPVRQGPCQPDPIVKRRRHWGRQRCTVALSA